LIIIRAATDGGCDLNTHIPASTHAMIHVRDLAEELLKKCRHIKAVTFVRDNDEPQLVAFS
jgi:hypothetical protein